MEFSAFARWFPVPMAMLPLAAGIDISDASIRWLALEETAAGTRVKSWGEELLESGIVTRGIVRDQSRLSEALARVKTKLGGIECAHASLPEEAAYVFGMRVPDVSDRDQVMNMIGFELEARVPIPPAAAIYDFDLMHSHDESGVEIGVVVFARDVVDTYASAFAASGMQLLSLELEASSMARAISGAGEPVELLVDFGRERSGFAIVKSGIPLFTSTVNVGCDAMTRIIMETVSLSAEEAQAFNDEHGLVAEEGKKVPGLEAVAGVASALADEVVRHYRYWDTRRNERGERVTPVERIMLVGGGANLRGLDEYLAARAHAPVVRPNVWRNVCRFEEYIPPIDRRTSLQYATVIGLALRGVRARH